MSQQKMTEIAQRKENRFKVGVVSTDRPPRCDRQLHQRWNNEFYL